MTTPDAQLEQLLTEAEWIRRLARSLVGEEGDDLAQDAWVAILQRPPDPARPPRPWLKRVVANLRATRARTFVRRRERESAALEEGKAAADPEALTARMQIQHRLAHLVMELPEPFRATVIACYYEGQSPSEMASSRDEPAGTVRWRLKRGLDLLRQRRDEPSLEEKVRAAMSWDDPSSGGQSFARGMQLICESPSEVSQQAEAGAQVTEASKWLSAHLTNLAARELWASLAPLPPEEKARRVQRVAALAGISRCPVAELWSAPERP